MTNERPKEGIDQIMTGAMRWDLGIGSEHRNDVVWRCDGLRAGKLYSRSTFGSREEADHFAQKMRRTEPDQMFHVEAITASAVWN